MGKITARLEALGYVLPQPAPAIAAYVPFVVQNNLVYISGQLPMEQGKVAVTGHLGAEIDIATGQRAAKICALNLLAQLQAACNGDLERVTRCVRLGGFVASASGFHDQPKVMNGASEVIEQIFSDKGRHARSSVGVNELPVNAAVEVEGLFAIA
ncbi:MAG: RidA family protein [Bdellovibrionales bacterium]